LLTFGDKQIVALISDGHVQGSVSYTQTPLVRFVVNFLSHSKSNKMEFEPN